MLTLLAVGLFWCSYVYWGVDAGDEDPTYPNTTESV